MRTAHPAAAPLRQPSLLALRAFEAAARRMSFTEAARELHVSQAAISRHVRALEEDLNVTLFRRLHRRVELTATGQQLATRLSAGFQQLHGAVDAVRRRSERQLRVTAEPAFAALWLIPRLDQFAAAHPNIELNLETSIEIRALGRDADVAIRYAGLGMRRQWRKARRLLEVDGVPVAAGTQRVTPKAASDRAVLDYRLLHDDSVGWRRWFAAAGVTGYDEARHAHFSDHTLALDAARRGQGVALGTAIFVEPEVAAGSLKVIGTTRVPLGTYWLLQAADRATAAARAAFTRWIDAQINSRSDT